MAIIDKVNGNLTGKWDDVAEKWVKPPELIKEKKSTITVNPIAILAENLLADRSVIDKWIGVSPILNAFFSGVERNLSFNEIEALKMIVADDKDNIDNPLTKEVGDKLLQILSALQEKVSK
jgi:hypothetical protein